MVQPNQENPNLENQRNNRKVEPRRRRASSSSPRTLRTSSKRSQEEVLFRTQPINKLRRTDSTSHYFSHQQASSSNSNINAIYIPSDNEEEEQRLNREISDLYQQIKIKKERIEKIRIDRAVRQREIEIRRETRRWLPTLDRVNQVRNEIINNLSESDSDSDMFDDLPTAEELFDSIFNFKDEANNKNSNNNTSSLNDVE